VKIENSLYIINNQLVVSSNKDNFLSFDIDKIQNAKIKEITNKNYNIILSFIIISGVCFLILQQYILILPFFYIPYLLVYLFYNQKKKIINFKYQDEYFEFLLKENDFFKLDDVLKYILFKDILKT
jgi:hypothetical protein